MTKERRERSWEETPPKAPTRVDLTQAEGAALSALVAKLNGTTPLTDAAIVRIERARRPDFIGDPQGAKRLIEELQKEERPLPHLSLPDTERADYMKRTDNDLPEQVKILDRSFDHWLRSATIPAPYYAHRVAVILRKAKGHDLERDFLAAWLRHFPAGSGGRYDSLADRGRKLGIE